ncbi:deaminase domain-containing protein [Kosakonia pseudosacchari]|nr:deaminase domain-containing protein [Kosakonia pseudosacchari]WBU51729.1 deaminase domain-containing protein [Kosakonia pseudosacchari]
MVVDVRARLPSSPKRSGNVAVAEINIPGIPTSLAAHSGVNEAGKGLLGEGSQNFQYQTLPNNKGIPIGRNTDSEYKILDNLADQLGSQTSAKGTVTIFTERPACGSCLGVVEQFQKNIQALRLMYWTITVLYLDQEQKNELRTCYVPRNQAVVFR